MKLVEKRPRHLADTKYTDSSRLALASQLTVLQSALEQVLRILKSRGSSLLAAKLLVVARLLHKTLSQESDVPQLVQSLGRRLAMLRKKLLRHVDRRLARTHVDTESLVQDMTAFSLATSSTSADVLVHFQQLRIKAIGRSIVTSDETAQTTMLRRLRLFLATMQESRMIFPELLGAALRVLGTRPLLKDDTIIVISELDLEIHERWFSDEVRNFTPYTRHDTLTGEQAGELFREWAQRALGTLTEAIKLDLAHETNLQQVASLRKEVLQTFLSSKRDAQGLKSRRALEELRSPFASRMEDLVRQTFGGMQTTLSTTIAEVLDNWSSNSSNITCPSLWDASTVNMEIGNGAMLFRQAIIDRRMGTSTSIKQILQGFDARAKGLADMQAVIKDMKTTRWDDDFDDDDDGDYETDGNNDYDSTRDSLTRIDPQDLQAVLSDSAREFVQNIEHFFNSNLQHRIKDCSTAASPGIWTLRILRGLRLSLPRLLAPINKQLSQSLLCSNLVGVLQSRIRDTVDANTVPVFSLSLDAFIRSQRPVRSLWDGTPALPVMPTPATFRFLRVVVKEMQTLGTDLWNSELVAALKSALGKAVAEQIDGVVRREMQAAEEAVEAVTSSAKTLSDPNTSTSANENAAPDAQDDHDAEGAQLRQEHDALATPHEGEQEAQEDNYVANMLLSAPNSHHATVPPQQPQDDASPEKTPIPTPNASSSTTEAAEPIDDTTTPDSAAATPEATPAAATTPDTTLTRTRLASTHDKLTQLLFDVLYLQQALSVPASPSTSTSTSIAQEQTQPLSRTAYEIAVARRSLVHAARKVARTPPGDDVRDAQEEEDVGAGSQGDDDDAREGREMDRLNKAAAEYWRRTYALFGLLGGSV